MAAANGKYAAPALVVGDGLNALGVIRSLAAASIPVVAMTTDPRAPSALTRYGRKQLVGNLHDDSLVHDLLRFAAGSMARPIVFLTEEGSVRVVSEHRDRLADRIAIRLPEHHRLMELMHKSGFQSLAERFGAPIPKLRQLTKESDLESLSDLRFPCVLKPGAKNYEYGARFKKAYVIQSRDEARALWQEISPVLPDLVVQEWIEGEDGDIYFCLQYVGESGAVGSFPGRKVRSWPLRIGGTASCAPAWEHEAELARLTTEFFSRAGFSGMGSMEYKRNRRDGKFYMIEPTVARTDFQEEIATLNGVNLPAIAYCHEAGLPLPVATRPDRPRVWREPQIDRWAMDAAGNRENGFGEALVCDSYLRWSDPGPWVGFMRSRVAERIKTLRRA